MKIKVVCIFLLLFSTASTLFSQWIESRSDASAQSSLKSSSSMLFGAPVAIGAPAGSTYVLPLADTTLRLSYPVGDASAPCNTYPTDVYRCFLLALGTPTAQWYGFRLDSGNNLHLSSQTDSSGWRDSVTFKRSGDFVVSGNAVPLHIDSASGGIGRAEFRPSSYPDAVMLEMTSNSQILVGNLLLGVLGLPLVQSTSTSPLFLNRWQNTDVEVSNYGYTSGLKVLGSGPSGFVGRVGIGTTSPSSSYVLDVVGNAHVSGTLSGGNIQATYQDVAEWVPSDSHLLAGTVVVLDSQHPNHVTSSARAYDTTVAGVVSAKPGIALGEAGDSKALIATTGRVRVRVDASRQPIAIGDLLVTSEKTGTAMKSIPIDVQGIALHRPGTVLGKALEPLPSGEGEILVLLSLQ